MIKELMFKLIDSRKLNKVYHRGCGGHVGYIADASKLKTDSTNFYFLDGLQPKKYDKKAIPCNKCGNTIVHLGDLIFSN